MSDNLHYTDEKNVLALMAMLKAHGISRVVASPGGTNYPLVGSLQNDSYFKVFSAVDERHAAYLACGMASESGEPVVLSCTGATASRNYLSGLTEAYYRKLPILVVTSSQPDAHMGQLFAQMTDRNHPAPDVVRYAVTCPIAKTDGEMADCARAISKAILELTRHGGGPVHINLISSYSPNFNVSLLPSISKMVRVSPYDEMWPSIPDKSKIVIWIGSHERFTADEERIVSEFARHYDAIVIEDHTGNYHGANALCASLICAQGIRDNPKYGNLRPDLIIHIGEVSGDYPTIGYLESRAEVWRVNIDGEFRDRLYRITTVFEMREKDFFAHYVALKDTCQQSTYADAWLRADAMLRARLPEVPFSNIWISNKLSAMLPSACVVQSGILNSLRSRNFTTINSDICESSTVGGFGIDGCVSNLIGASLVHPDKLYFGIFGDLSFFYDLNAIGNRHVGNNLRILLVNNGAGAEFNNYSCAASVFGSHTNDYIAAGGHFGGKSRTLVKHFAEDLGFMYISADDKCSFETAAPQFVAPSSRPIVFECFTDLQDESNALKAYSTIDPNRSLKSEMKKMMPQKFKNVVKGLIG